MNKKLKAALKVVYSPPPPQKKREFLSESTSKIPTKPLGYIGFMRSQLGYIRARIWLLSLAVFAVCLYLMLDTEQNMLPYISAFMPMLALAVICESERSSCFKMFELEMSTRFSLKSVMLARMCILGTVDLALVLVIIPLAGMQSGTPLLEAAACILFPYLLTAFTGLLISRKLRGGEAVYAGIGVAALISVGCLLLARLDGFSLYKPERLMLATLASAIGAGVEFRKTILQTEELQWSL